MTLTLIFATWFQPEWRRCVESWCWPSIIVPKMNIVPAYQLAFEQCSSDILGYLHDDLICEDENWRERVMREFEDPAVGIVGFAGGFGYCHPSMTQFNPQGMGRIGFCSNLKNAEIHGGRMTTAINAVVLDGMSIFIRREALVKAGGWPVGKVDYFQYTEWVCCAVRRAGYKIRVVGVAVDHLGGRSTGYNPNLNPDWHAEHKAVWDEFSSDGTIPAMVTP